MYRPISNNIHLTGDNLGVFFCLKRGSSRNLFANEILKSLAHFWLNSQFFLNVLYIKSADNPADFYTRYFLIDWSFFHIPGVLCVLQSFTLIGNYVFRDLVRLQLIIWPYNFTKSWFLGVKILYKICRILWDTPCFCKGDENFVQLFLPLCDQSDHGVRVTIRSVLVEQG